jgi:hypothetical protein
VSKRAARRLGAMHLSLAGVWTVLAVPTALWLKDSVLWVAMCSLYANAWLHIGAWQAVRAERAASSGD